MRYNLGRTWNEGVGVRIATYVGMALIGLLTGMIVNYLCDRLPWRRSIGKPLCHACGQERMWKAFLLMSTCPHCNRKSSVRSYLVLLLSLLLALFVFPRYGFGFFVLLEYFLLVTVMDIEHHVILHPVSAFGLILGMILGIQMHGWVSTLLGGLLAGGLMGMVYLLGLHYGRWIARRRKLEQAEEGLGFGDVTLSTILGLILGFNDIPRGLTLGILLGGVFGLFWLLWTRRSASQTAIPYAPFLLVGAIIVLFS